MLQPIFDENKFEETLEKLSTAENVCFDKTGVLTSENGKIVGLF